MWQIPCLLTPRGAYGAKATEDGAEVAEDSEDNAGEDTARIRRGYGRIVKQVDTLTEEVEITVLL